MLATSVLMPGWGFHVAFWAQLAFYALGLVGMLPAVGSRMRLAGAAASFLVLNAAAWLAFWVWISGRAGRSWRKITYQESGVRNQESEIRGSDSRILQS